MQSDQDLTWDFHLPEATNDQGHIIINNIFLSGYRQRFGAGVTQRETEDIPNGMNMGHKSFLMIE